MVPITSFLIAAALFLSSASASSSPQVTTVAKATTACASSVLFTTAGFIITDFTPIMPYSTGTAANFRPNPTWAAEHYLVSTGFGSTPGYTDYKCQYNCGYDGRQCNGYYITDTGDCVGYDAPFTPDILIPANSNDAGVGVFYDRVC